MEADDWKIIAICFIVICAILLGAELYEHYDGFLTVKGYCEQIDNQNVTIDGVTYHCSFIPDSLFYLEGRHISITFVEENDGLVLRSTGYWIEP